MLSRDVRAHFSDVSPDSGNLYPRIIYTPTGDADGRSGHRPGENCAELSPTR